MSGRNLLRKTAAVAAMIIMTGVTALSPMGSANAAENAFFLKYESIISDEPSGDRASEDKVRAFAARMYTIVLEREPEKDGLDYWTQRLISGEATGADIADGFVLSEEFVGKNVSNREFITRLYRTFLDREPDADGAAYWEKRLRQGFRRRFVLQGFVNSTEFGEICDSYGIKRGYMRLTYRDRTRSDDNLHIDAEAVASYVERLYAIILGRESDEAGRKYWIEEITSHRMTAANVAKDGFFSSKEYTSAKKSDKDFVGDVYRVMLNREADEDGAAYWVERLETGSITRSEMIEKGFGGSKEFRELLLGYGLISEDASDAPVNRVLYVGDSRSVDMFSSSAGYIEQEDIDGFTVYCCDGVYAKYLRWVIDTRGLDSFDTLITWMGANDRGNFDGYVDIYDEVLAHGKTLVLCSVGPSCDKDLDEYDYPAYTNEYMDRVNDRLYQYARENKVPVIDLHTYVLENLSIDYDGIHYGPKPTRSVWNYIRENL